MVQLDSLYMTSCYCLIVNTFCLPPFSFYSHSKLFSYLKLSLAISGTIQTPPPLTQTHTHTHTQTRAFFFQNRLVSFLGQREGFQQKFQFKFLLEAFNVQCVFFLLLLLCFFLDIFVRDTDIDTHTMWRV